MRKIMLAILMIALFSTTGLTQGSRILGDFELDDFVTYRIIEKSSVSIFSLGQYLVNCSGVIIGENKTQTFVLTCKHCLTVSEEMYANEKKVNFIITASDEDLALLIVNGKIKNKEKAQIGKYIYVEDKIYTIGYPNYTLKPRKAKGEITRFTDDYAWSTVNVIGGCSGSGFFNKKGELVGIVWGSVGELSIFEPIKDVKRFLERINYETLKQD